VSFPSYREYKDSRLDWIGKIPDGWQLKPLKYVASCNDEALPDNTPEDFEIMYVEISDVDEVQGIRNLTKLPFGRAPSRARRIARDGDVLVSTVRTYLRAIAPVEQAPDNLVASTGFAVIRPRSLDYRFAGYLLRAEWLISRIIARSVGVNYPAIRADEIMALSVPVPSIREQRQIADFLDHETTKIDALIEEQQRLIELLDEKRQAVISHAVTKGLDPDAPMKDSCVEWLGDVPAHWAVSALRHFATIRGGLAIGKKYPEAQNLIEVPYLRVANVQDGYVDLSELKTIGVFNAEADHYALDEGDVLMNEGGDNDKLGRGTVWDAPVEHCLHQNHVFAIRCGCRLLPEWLALFTRSASARAYFYLYSKQSTNLASISSSNVMSCVIPVPPVQEQQQILKQVSSRLDKVAGLIDEAGAAIKLLKERRSALISAAVTGKIDVRNWQPEAGLTEGLPMAAEDSATYEASEP